MKTIIIFILLGAFFSPFALQAQDQQKLLYQTKVAKYTKMKHTGIGLTIGGAVLSTVGIALMVDGLNKNSSSTYDPYDPYATSSDDGSVEATIGYLSFILGIPATAGGITLWSIGGSKVKSYNQKLNSLSLNLNPGRNQMFSLAYRF